MNPFLILVFGASAGIAGGGDVAATPADHVTVVASVDSVSQSQQGVMNRQVLDIGPDTPPGAGTRITISRVRQAQGGLGNDQRMALGSVRE